MEKSQGKRNYHTNPVSFYYLESCYLAYSSGLWGFLHGCLSCPRKSFKQSILNHAVTGLTSASDVGNLTEARTTDPYWWPHTGNWLFGALRPLGRYWGLRWGKAASLIKWEEMSFLVISKLAHKCQRYANVQKSTLCEQDTEVWINNKLHITSSSLYSHYHRPCFYFYTVPHTHSHNARFHDHSQPTSANRTSDWYCSLSTLQSAKLNNH